MNFVVAELVKDKTTWVGSVATLIANVSQKFEVRPPDTLEGWGAVLLSFATIFYIVTKTILLLRENRKSEKEKA